MFQPSEEGAASLALVCMNFQDSLETRQGQVRRHGGLAQAEISSQTGHNLQEDTTKPARRCGAPAFILASVSPAVTGEDRLVNVNINTFPSCLSPASRGAIQDFKSPLQ